MTPMDAIWLVLVKTIIRPLQECRKGLRSGGGAQILNRVDLHDKNLIPMERF